MLTQDLAMIFHVDFDFNTPGAVGPLFWWVFWKFACGLGFAGRWTKLKTNKKRKRKREREKKRNQESMNSKYNDN